MKYIDEFRDGDAARRVADTIAAEARPTVHNKNKKLIIENKNEVWEYSIICGS